MQRSCSSRETLRETRDVVMVPVPSLSCPEELHQAPLFWLRRGPYCLDPQILVLTWAALTTNLICKMLWTQNPRAGILLYNLMTYI